ncbi:FadR/GntR family transcriptional regulator [Paenisporosarcina cavernae]|uniref:FadR family transcriptional regulator n=1 Tax=Paenisporosarcina cavernae TaxID=2320858 RepID=A0A385YVX0_9BACL|nr:GntR family transcriptional regulator [Paenisporosarcina cavernae]AYC29838.1 FadR family transcriptional regulator [Paenisporosarcina cavernae]
MTTVSQKGFLSIVRSLRELITAENLKTGDKLPSERELSERLGVGRSSVREALRSLELLGLIETRRGEGTFLTDFRKHQLVEVLATFILQDKQSIKDVHITRQILEKEAISIIVDNESVLALPIWKGLLLKLEQDESFLIESFMREILVLAENRLALKMWILLHHFSNKPYDHDASLKEKEAINSFLIELIQGHKEHALDAYSTWMKLYEKDVKR